MIIVSAVVMVMPGGGVEWGSSISAWSGENLKCVFGKNVSVDLLKTPSDILMFFCRIGVIFHWRC